MVTKSSVAIAALIFVAGLAVGATYMRRVDRNAEPKQTDTSVVFPDNVYSDMGTTVTATGRWTGEGVGYKNNAVLVYCDHQQLMCMFYTVEQIGINQVGTLDIPDEMPITHWDDSVITATDAGQDAGVLCVKNTINIDRKNQTTELVMEPINQSKLTCAKADNKIYKWWLGGSIFWDQMRAAAAAKNGK